MNSWHHVAYTTTTSGYSIYLDGTQARSVGFSGTPLLYDANHTLILGATGATNDTFTGSIDEVRVSNVARSADWIATEYNNQSSPQTFAIVGGAPYFWITSTSLPAATAYYSYNATVATQNGTAPYAWSIVSGALPAGLSIDSSTGVISGTTTEQGTPSFTVQAVDANSNTSSRALTLTVNAPPPPQVVTTSLPAATLGVAYSASLNATAGVTPYNWSLISGPLPTGLSLSTSGSISGTPTATGGSTFTVQVQDSLGNLGSKSLSMLVFQVTGLTPSSGAIGGTVTVSGSGFGSSQGSNSVSFNGVAAAVSSWSDGSIVVQVPTGATSGPVTVQANGGVSNSVQFNVEGQPTIASVSPSLGVWAVR